MATLRPFILSKGAPPPCGSSAQPLAHSLIGRREAGLATIGCRSATQACPCPPPQQDLTLVVPSLCGPSTQHSKHFKLWPHMGSRKTR